MDEDEEYVGAEDAVAILRPESALSIAGSTGFAAPTRIPVSRHFQLASSRLDGKAIISSSCKVSQHLTDSFDTTGAIIRLGSQGIELKGGREDGDNEDGGEERRRGDCQGRRRAHPAFVVPLVALAPSVLAEPLPQEDQPSLAGGVPHSHVAVLQPATSVSNI